MRIALVALAWLLAAGPCHAADLLVHECPGAHGERVFSDRGSCAAVALRSLSLPNPPAAALVPKAKPEKAARSRGPRAASGRSRARVTEPESFFCSSAKLSWYHHSTCSAAGGADKKNPPVRQTRVSRRQACSEIDRPRSVLRNGSRRDQRAGPYDKVMGRDPCR